MTDFLPGQLWISNVEPKLGLGLILEVAYKRVTVSFLGNETRIYAQDSTQLTRFQFSKGNLIESIDGDKLTVTSVNLQDGLITYLGKNEDTQDVQMNEMALNHYIHINKKSDQLFTDSVSEKIITRYDFNDGNGSIPARVARENILYQCLAKHGYTVYSPH